MILPLQQNILIVLSSISHQVSPMCHFTGKHGSNTREPPFIINFQVSSNFLLAEITVQARLYCKSRKYIRAGNGSYLDEFGWREDSLVGHSGCRYYNRGIVLLLQPLIEHLHMEETQEAKSAGGQEGSQVHSSFVIDIHAFNYKEPVWKEFNSEYNSLLFQCTFILPNDLNHCHW